nr:hypothetical protein [Burkholderia sp. BCC1988]
MSEMVDRERQLVAFRAPTVGIGSLHTGVEDEYVNPGFAELLFHRIGELANTVERGKIERYDFDAARRWSSGAPGTDYDPRAGPGSDVLQGICAESRCSACHDDNALLFGYIHDCVPCLMSIVQSVTG